MSQFKPISKDAIPAALEKARHYRLLNQPWQAESICHDILNTEPGNQQAIYTLVMTLSDQFDNGSLYVTKALEMSKQLSDNYQKEYCLGLIYERQAISASKRSTPRAGHIAYDHMQKALAHYESAIDNRPPANDESLLRWNGCIRFIEHHNLQPSPEEKRRQPFLDV